MNIGCRIHELWYSLKCWAWHRWSTVKPRTLPHTWCDRRELLAHMMFEILGQFIERECSPGIVEWYGESGDKISVDGKEKFVRDEMQELWDWWCNDYLKGYPAREEAIWREIERIQAESLVDREQWRSFDPQYKTTEAEAVESLFSQLNALEAEAEDELARRLHRLVAVRQAMWT
jgi:hypothetical protein